MRTLANIGFHTQTQSSQSLPRKKPLKISPKEMSSVRSLRFDFRPVKLAQWEIDVSAKLSAPVANGWAPCVPPLMVT